MIRRLQALVVATVLIVAAFSTGLEFLFYLLYLGILVLGGSYVLVPVYAAAQTTFDVQPAELGFALTATRGTAVHLRAHGVECGVVFKVNEGRPSLADEIVNRRIHMVVNTPLGLESFFDDKAVRRAAMMAGIPCITTMTGAAAAVDAVRALKGRELGVCSLQEYYVTAASVS